VILAAPLVLLAAALAAAGDETLLPAAGVVAGCTRYGAVLVYPGAELYGLIDGGAEIFLELGFERATVQRYACGGEEISLELYRMRDATAALGVYVQKCGRETPDPSLAARHTIGRVQLQLVRGDLYLVATADAPGEEIRAALLGLAGAVVDRLPTTGAADPFAALPRERLVAGSERVIRGQFGLQAIVTLGDGDVLQLQDNDVTAAAGSYLDEHGNRFSRVVADYPTAAAASAALAGVSAGLDPYLTPLERSAARLVYRDHAGRFGSITVTGRRLELLCDLVAPPVPTTTP